MGRRQQLTATRCCLDSFSVSKSLTRSDHNGCCGHALFPRIDLKSGVSRDLLELSVVERWNHLLMPTKRSYIRARPNTIYSEMD